MNEPFDPLHRWLGIPPEEQPPNHYRLLGLKQFESNRDVIEAAAEQRLSYVRSASTGKHAEHSQSVLNSLAAAQGCLLDAKKKAAYDRSLKSGQLKKAVPLVASPAQATASPAARPQLVPNAKANQVDDPLGLIFPANAATPTRFAARAKPTPPWAVYAGVGGVVLAVIIGVAIFAASGKTPRTEARVVPNAAPNAGKQTPGSPPPPPVHYALPAPKAPEGTGAISETPLPSTNITEAKPTTEERQPLQPGERLKVPVLARAASDKMLLVCAGSELEKAVAVCKQFGLPHEPWKFDMHRTDFAGVHAILAGTNAMDYWGAAEDRKRAEAFRGLDDFVERGGHLVIMGSFNGRNTQHLAKYGIETATTHCDLFREVPEHSEVFFRGAESVVPANKHLRNAGNFWVKQPHVVLLNRGDAGDGPSLVTLAVGKGRLTFTLAEPEWMGDQWFVTVLTRWVARGAPTQLDDQEIPLRLAPVVAASDPAGRPAALGPDFALPPQAVAQPARLAIPDAAAQRQANTTIREVFRDQFKAKTVSEKQAFAETLLKSALETVGDPASQYALLQEAMAQAMALKDATLVFRAIDELSARYDVDGPGLKVDALGKLAKVARDAPSSAAIVQTSLDLAADMIDSGDYAAAVQLTALAASMAPRTQSRHLLGLTPIMEKQAKLLAREYERVAEHARTLKKKPDDPTANYEVGRFLCFVKRDWPSGLPLFAKTAHENLKSLAERELSTMPISVDAKKMGDDWAEVAAELSPDERLAAQQRARSWYARALSSAKGLARADTETKLAKLPSPRFQVAVKVRAVHGAEELRLTASQISWVHLSWGLPASVSLNEFPFDIHKSLTLRNRGATQILPLDIDFSTARVQKVRGRGTMAITSTHNEAVLHIDDGPDGADDYECVVAFGR